MKKLLFILILFGIGIQTGFGQCSQPYDLSPLPDWKVYKNTVPLSSGFNDPAGTGSNFPEVSSQFIGPNGDLYISGTFDWLKQFDGTPNGSMQILTGLNGFAKRDAITKIWSAVTPPPSFSSGDGILKTWYVNGSIYANSLSNNSSPTFKKQNTDGTWGPSLFSYSVYSIKPSSLPNEYYIAAISGLSGDLTGIQKWNTLTNTLTVTAMRPDFSSWYTINESQTSDTLNVLLHDMGTTSPMVLIKGQTELIQYDNAFGIKNPAYGYDSIPPYGLGSIYDVFFVPNGKVYAMGINSIIPKLALMVWNNNTKVWELIIEHASGLYGDYNVMWYDSVTNEIHVPYGRIICNTNTYIENVDPNTRAILRQANTLLSVREGTYLEDTTASAPPNTTTINSVVNVVGAQNIAFTASNGHDGDMAKMYEYGLVIDSLAIDNTNCGGFTINHFVDIGTHYYDFTLTDTSGNESSPTTLEVEVSYPTKLDDFDKDFATIFTVGKTISISGDMNHILLYDLTGQVIFSKNVTNGTFFESFEYLPSGIYFIKVYSTSNKKQMTRKLSF